jgi:hypothetical protein
MNKALIPLAAIISIAVIEAMALTRGIDGVLLSISIAAISGLGGYSIRSIIGGKKDVSHT